jgi:hypothetical protein
MILYPDGMVQQVIFVDAMSCKQTISPVLEKVCFE